MRDGQRLAGVAFDGTSVRGAAAGGHTRPHLLGAATHDGAIVFAQRPVPDKGSELMTEPWPRRHRTINTCCRCDRSTRMAGHVPDPPRTTAAAQMPVGKRSHSAVPDCAPSPNTSIRALSHLL